MKTAVIAGASGLVGTALLPMLLEHSDYDKVISLGRKTLPLHHPKLQQMVVDFSDLSAFKSPCHDVFCCLGTTIRAAGSKERFFQVDHDFPLRLAEAALRNGAVCFTIITAIASDPNSRIYYSSVKGKLEQQLMQMGYKNLNILRPSMLLGARKEFRAAEWVSKQIMNLLRPIIPAKYRAVKDIAVARCMLLQSLNNQRGTHIIENAEILKY